MFKLTIPGPVVAKQSARFCQVAGFIKSYQKDTVVNYANYVKMCFLQKYPNNDVSKLKGKMLEIHITEYRQIQKSKPKKFIQQALEGFLRPITKPDTDNIAKNIKDALNKVAYYDDSQIVKEVIEKCYSDNPRVEVEIKEWENK